VIYAHVYISMVCTVDGDLRLCGVRDEGLTKQLPPARLRLPAWRMAYPDTEAPQSCPKSPSASALQVSESTTSENRGSTAHKLVFVGVAFALGVGEVRNTAHGPGIGSEPTTLRLTAS
jgi:hypothetical protein